jgi:hypothetical protein
LLGSVPTDDQTCPGLEATEISRITIYVPLDEEAGVYTRVDPAEV